MALNATRAVSVCNVCRKRKRACDKTLPSCSYCSKTGRICKYVDHIAGRKLEPGFSNDPNVPGVYQLQGHGSAMPNGVADAGIMDAEEEIYYPVAQNLRPIDLLPDEVASAYFHGFHKWLPIVDERTFNRSLCDGRRSSRNTEDSLLLLTMALIAFPESTLGRMTHTTAPRQVYFQAKMLFAEAQLTIPQSILVLQAGLLLSAFEYVRRNINAAQVTISTCIGLAQPLLHESVEKAERSSKIVSIDDPRTVERHPAWSSLVVLHSIIQAEAYSASSTKFKGLILNHNAKPESLYEHLQGEADAEKRCSQSGFTRLLQSVNMLRKVFNVLEMSQGDLEMIAALLQLDTELRAFLDKVLTEMVDESLRRNVGAVSIVIRALFLLHEASPARLMDLDETYRAKRSATLDCISQMMVEVALTNVKHAEPLCLDRHPYTGVHNVRAAIQHLTQKSKSENSDQSVRVDLIDLHALDNLYAAHWGPRPDDIDRGQS